MHGGEGWVFSQVISLWSGLHEGEVDNENLYFAPIESGYPKEVDMIFSERHDRPVTG